MSGAYSPHSAATAALDADAVCELCGTVNPEGTFICRKCGNNLRDQKSRRLATEMQLLEPEGISGLQVFRGALVLFGMLLIGWVAINVNQITDALAGTGGANDPISSLFDSSASTVFDAMLLEAQALNPTFEQMEAVRAASVPGTSIDGNYVLVHNDYYTGVNVVGSAVVRTDESGTRFVAALGPDLHIRGMARNQGQTALRADWHEAAARDATGRIYAVTGVAVPQLDGSVECFGQSASDQTANFEIVAYRLP